MLRALPFLALALLASPVVAQPICVADDERVPFVDAEVLGCGGALPRLTVVREQPIYDVGLREWRQAILLRFANPTDAELVISGVLTLRGAEVVGEPQYLADDLALGDLTWAIAPLSHYNDPGDCRALVEQPPIHPSRGLEFGDLTRFDADPGRVRFEFAAANDLDDVRIIVASPDPAPASRVEVEIVGFLSTPGIALQVGSADLDLAPDDGIYDATDTPVPIRLRAVDLAIEDDCLSGEAEGVAIDLTTPADSLTDGNGGLAPIEAVGAPDALRWRIDDLVSDAGDVLVADRLEGLDIADCVDGEAALPLTLVVDAPPGTPDGLYSGLLEIWQDDDGDRRFDGREAGDRVTIVYVAGAPPEGDPCDQIPIVDAAIVDAAIDDATVDDAQLEDAAVDDAAPQDAGAEDAGLDAQVDGGADAGLIDLDADLPLDGGEVDAEATDAGADRDGAADRGRDGGADGRIDVSLPPDDAGVADAGPDDPDGARDGQLDGGLDGGPDPDGAVVDPVDGAVDGAADDGLAADASVADGSTAIDGGADASVDGSTDAAMEPDGAPFTADSGVIDGRLDGGSGDASVEVDAAAIDAAADPGDPQGGALSCTATPGGDAPAWMGLLLVAALAGRRRLAVSLAMLGAALTLVPTPASAQVDTRRFHPTPTTSPYLNLDGSEALGSGAVAGRLVSAIEQRPLVFARDGARTVDIISVRLTLDAALAVGVTDWLDVAVAAPLVLLQDGRTVTDDGDLERFAIADPMLSARARLIPKTSGVGLSLRLAGTAPLGDDVALAGESGPTGQAVLAAELPVGSRFDIVLNAGYRMREKTALGDVELDDELLFGLGASWRTTEDFALALEFAGATAAADPFADAQQTPGGVDLVARVGLFDQMAVVVGAGGGLLPGYGSPLYRAFAGVEFAPRNHDFDGDGIVDRRDRCAATAGVAEEDGCPATAVADAGDARRARDQDLDGVVDALDLCPYLAEDRDGFRDDDGCPDVDNDLDLLADGFDVDPLGPEDWDSFEDGDGRPDLDNDQDGVADFRDACPDEAGGADGCPGSVAPAEPELADVGLARSAGPSAPLVLGRTIDPAEPIIFEFARPELSEAAGPFVDGLARYLLDNPTLDRIEVGVHVDAMGSRRWKHWLSRARAESVVEALVARGVPAERVFPRGYGPEVPVDSNATKAGRFNNRRVELRALLSFEKAAPTRAKRPTRTRARPAPVRRLPPPRDRWLPDDAVVLRPDQAIIFVRKKPALTAEARTLVRGLARQLKDNPGWRRVEVGVHTDGLGDLHWKMRLSQRRAEVVREALIAEGIEPGRLVARGYGATRRLRDDTTLESRFRNRRVELRVLDISVSLAPGGER